MQARCTCTTGEVSASGAIHSGRKFITARAPATTAQEAPAAGVGVDGTPPRVEQDAQLARSTPLHRRSARRQMNAHRAMLVASSARWLSRLEIGVNSGGPLQKNVQFQNHSFFLDFETKMFHVGTHPGPHCKPGTPFLHWVPLVHNQ